MALCINTEYKIPRVTESVPYLYKLPRTPALASCTGILETNRYIQVMEKHGTVREKYDQIVLVPQCL